MSELAHQLRRGIWAIALLAVIIIMVFPAEVLAYQESMSEIMICGDPGVIIQNQNYRTSTRQTLFHTADNALTDTETFAFGGFSPAGIKLAQTVAATAAGSETGYFTSSASSDIVPPVHIGSGFLGTWIGDPLWTGAPIFAGLTFPSMTPTDVSALASMPQGLSGSGSGVTMDAAGSGSAGTSQPAGQTASKNTTAAPGNNSSRSIAADVSDFRPVINNALNDTLSDPDARNATAVVTNATAASATKKNESAQAATPGPSPAPSPGIKPGQPFYHQQNKPFSTALTSPSGPFKATAASTANTTGFDRFLRNTVGRSTTDKAFNGTTSSPTYITPAEALAEQIPYDFIQGGRGMTMPGTHLNYRAWPL